MTALLLLAQVLVVSPRGPYTTLGAAVAAAPAGATIAVRAGRYREPTVRIDRPLVLRGDSGAVLDGEERRALLDVRADDVTIRGFTFVATGTSYTEDRAAVRVTDGKRCRIEANRFERTLFAIYLAGVHECLVADNVIDGLGGRRESANGNGIHLWSSRDVTVRGNRIRRHRDGIYLEFCRHATVVDNESRSNLRYGLHFMYSDSSAYRGNRFLANGSGVAVMYTRSVTMEGNTFADNRGAAAYGLLLKEIQDARLMGNTFRDNTVGVMADGADRMLATRNRVVDNGWGVRLYGSTTGARFEENAFAGNSFDLSTNGDRAGAVFARNWWHDYHGWDLNRDGVGDAPFHPVRLFSRFVAQVEPALLLQRSPFVRLLDGAERIFPVLTPRDAVDSFPLLRDPTVVAR